MNLWSPDIYAKAWEFATLAHQEQTYGGKTEGIKINYINHIGSVAMEVMNAIQLSSHHIDSNLAIQCALLHDIIEDTKFTYNDIKNKFGQNVADGVLALTKNEDISSKNLMMIDSLNRIKQQPHEVWMVKMADRICNLYHPPYYWNNKKINSYREEAKTIFNNLNIANETLANRLDNKIKDYESFLS
ncbi:HD domain-containing protein [Aquimarina algiphila]|uniref:HD domain-containing protein n=1 Tax=Aquimarina algiphila TaxID=2047982 RepID=UPI00232B9F0C|nr:HD domain-containing protein [Aquimarina algiphila]